MEQSREREDRNDLLVEQEEKSTTMYNSIHNPDISRYHSVRNEHLHDSPSYSTE